MASNTRSLTLGDIDKVIKDVRSFDTWTKRYIDAPTYKSTPLFTLNVKSGETYQLEDGSFLITVNPDDIPNLDKTPPIVVKCNVDKRKIRWPENDPS